jgi:hypothetical protein
MSWAAIAVLAAGAYGFKVLGVVVLGPRAATGRLLAIAALLPPAVLTALVVVQTVGGDRALVVDARLAGVAAGVVAVWRRAPFVVVIAVAAAVAAAVRAVS